jgi:hypothetical protein
MTMRGRVESLRDFLTPERGRRLKVASNAGLGAAVGVLLYKHLVGSWGLWAVTWPVWLAVLLTLAIDNGILGTLFPMSRVVPSSARGRPSPGALTSPGELENILNFSPAVFTALLTAYTLIMTARGRSAKVEEPFSLVMVGVIGAAMAWYWWAGVRRDPRDARWLGAAAGVVAAALFAIAAVLLYGRQAPLVLAGKQVMVFAMSWGLYGFAGGLALDRGKAWRPGARAGIGVAAAVLALGLLNWLFDRSFPWGEEACLAAGLGAGLMFMKPRDTFLESTPTADVTPQALKAILPG